MPKREISADLLLLRFSAISQAIEGANRRDWEDVVARFDLGTIEGALRTTLVDPSPQRFSEDAAREFARRLNVRRERKAQDPMAAAMEIRVCAECGDENWVSLPEQAKPGYGAPIRPCSICWPVEYETWRLRTSRSAHL